MLAVCLGARHGNQSDASMTSARGTNPPAPSNELTDSTRLSSGNRSGIVIGVSVALIGGTVVITVLILLCRRRSLCTVRHVLSPIVLPPIRLAQQKKSNFRQWEFARDKVRLVRELGKLSSRLRVYLSKCMCLQPPCQSVYRSMCLSVCLPTCLSILPSVCMPLCLKL